ncbi:hypothetical protein DQ182_11700 [Enterococcus faecium]|nr:hypothetical protein [Enterococcus faecium]EGP5416765.1 hypothetical protein [Enterococcus faecium]EGP5632094.1 hypothetical protein [Enterococcus faecium]EGP5712688.1 hypothetical protein [Enterococcus faecium]EGP5720179.1 hypothetical protein [Enterococcus faecium]
MQLICFLKYQEGIKNGKEEERINKIKRLTTSCIDFKKTSFKKLTLESLRVVISLFMIRWKRASEST